MPKVKTHSGAKKRFSISGSGKLVFKKSGRSHLLECKNAKRRRRLRQKGVLGGTLGENVKKLLPYA
ncbi:MAG: 50S ribosomal protein L35 [Thermanaerothrix sp.]|nr:50S ribosomal protein L35 [Thermanaerothrix sp.]